MTLAGAARDRIRRWRAGFVPPVLLILALAALLAWLLPRPGVYAVKFVVAIALGLAVALLWWRTQRTNHAIARFILALQHGDLAQNFARSGDGMGHDALGTALNGALATLRAERHRSAADNRFAAALVDAVATPLVAIDDDDGTVHLANKAARRLFGDANGQTAPAFARYGGGFATTIATIRPGARAMTRVLWNGMPQRALVTAAAVERLGRPWRAISVAIIQTELERAELATQSDLVRVLTHEIMNSLTPVTSLAATAATMLREASPDDPDALDDARMAVDTLARRAAAITGFVDSYRDFGSTPPVTIERFAAQPWADEIVCSFTAMPQAVGVAFSHAVEPAALRIDGDAALLGQVLLNLLKNGAEAAADASNPAVSLTITSADAGRVLMTVTDNGGGIPEPMREEVFLPFFTTKPGGTGVGLSFARQVVTLHGGSIVARGADGGGTRFDILF